MDVTTIGLDRMRYHCRDGVVEPLDETLDLNRVALLLSDVLLGVILQWALQPG